MFTVQEDDAQKFDHPPKKILVTGASGSGKTTLAEKLMRSSARASNSSLITTGNSLPGSESSRCAAPACWMKQWPRGWVCYDPSEDFEDDFPKGLQFFCAYVLAPVEAASRSASSFTAMKSIF